MLIRKPPQWIGGTKDLKRLILKLLARRWFFDV